MVDRTRLSCRALLAGLACGTVLAQAAHGSESPAELRARAQRMIELHTFGVLRPMDQEKIGRAGTFAFSPAPMSLSFAGPTRTPDENYAAVRRLLDRQTFDSFSAVHQSGLANMMHRAAEGKAVPMMCFAEGTSPQLMDAFRRLFLTSRDRFNQGDRWFTTASTPGPTAQGDRIVLTYSFIADGVLVPTFGADAPNNLNATFDGIFGTTDAWRSLYAQVFQRWSQLCGVTYVFEPNDDGLTLGAVNSSGVLGVRGDCRLGGAPLDGAGSVLAFNYLPAADEGGDMVVDTGDSANYSNATNNYRFLRNVLMHEHGHGLGMFHVCPRTQTKLMEPFISTAFDGPQLDDILNGQRFYGDQLEPNDTPASAVALLLGTTTPLSLDGAGDVDFYTFTVSTVPARLSVEVTPLGTIYAEGPQDSQCTASGSFDPARVLNVALEILSPGGTSVLASKDAAGPGGAERIDLPITIAGTYRIRVFQAGTIDSVQGYSINTVATNGQSLVIDLPSGAPAAVQTRVPTSFPVTVRSTSALVGTPKLFYRLTSGSYSSVDLIPTGTGLYQANLPRSPRCQTAQFYISAQSAGSGTVTLPAGAPATTFSAAPGQTLEVFADDFEIDRGWTYGAPGDTATTGQWTRDDPNPTGAQPGDTVSGTFCAFTGASVVNAGVGDNDVDSGFTTLISPTIDLTGAVSPSANYFRWYSNSAGSNPRAKVFTVDVSRDNGTTWTNLETVGPAGSEVNGGWFPIARSIPGPLTSTMRFRFRADDTGTGSAVEAALDDFRVTRMVCTPACGADYNASGTATVQDIFDFLSAWFAGEANADFTGDSGITVQDIFDFLAAWFAGC